ncbi:MAG: Ku protein [Rhizomicrobium sp.]
MAQAARRKKTAPKRAAPRTRSKGRHRAAANDDAPETGEKATLGRRPLWEGHLRLSLVSCPIALYPATTHTNDIAFHLLNPKTNNRIRMIPTDPDEGPVERATLVKGYEFEKNRYVVLTPEELDAVKLETTHTLDIERFVDETSIDRLFWNDPFYLLPSEPSGVQAYTVIHDAMAGAGRIALGRVVMHTRERLMAVEPRGRGLVAYTLRMRNEVIDADTVFRDIPREKPDRRMIEIAEKIIEQQEGPFAPDAFKDRYETALRKLIRRKERGEKIVAAEPPEESNVIDLMDALKRSLKGKSSAGHNPARRRSAR